MEDKIEIRREVRRRIKELDPRVRASAAEEIFTKIEQNDHFRQAGCIALFVAMHDEVATE